MKPLLKRAYLRAWARRNANDKDVKRMLNDDKLFDYVFEEAEEGHNGVFQDIIAWITGDPKGFLEFVKAIIALFSA